MTYKFILYSEEKPKGVVFEADNEVNAYQVALSKARDGWVDDPGKIGYNPWGEHAQPAIDKRRQLFLDGKIPAIDRPIDIDPEHQAELEIEAEQIYKTAQAEQDAVREPAADTRRTWRGRDEEINDQRSDLKMDREIGRGKGQEVPQNVNNPSKPRDESRGDIEDL